MGEGIARRLWSQKYSIVRPRLEVYQGQVSEIMSKTGLELSLIVLVLGAIVLLLLAISESPETLYRCSPQIEEFGCEDGAEFNTPYPHILFTHCGVLWTYFNGRWWEASPPLVDGDGNLPRGWGNPTDTGTIEMVSEGLARFTGGSGQTAEFKPLPVEIQKFPGDGRCA